MNSNGTFFIYGSFITLAPDIAPSGVLYNNTPIKTSLFAPAYISSPVVNVTLNSSFVQTLSNGSLRITLSQQEFQSFISQLFVKLLPFAPLTLQFGQPLVTVSLQAYCLVFFPLLLFFVLSFFFSSLFWREKTPLIFPCVVFVWVLQAFNWITIISWSDRPCCNYPNILSTFSLSLNWKESQNLSSEWFVYFIHGRGEFF